MDIEAFQEQMSIRGMAGWAALLPEQLSMIDNRSHGDLARWREALALLPDYADAEVDLNADCLRIGQAGDLNAEQQALLVEGLEGLRPWRKGPYCLFGQHLDTEWRSDWKWQRLVRHIQPLRGRAVLDVGCGNGYHCWRMAGAGAELVIGIDPSPLFLCQFQAMQKYIGAATGVHMLPLGIEAVPSGLRSFDTVFSMGVLYHRRSPVDHLLELGDALRDGGELVLETLVIEGDERQVLVPEERYAKMRNVWFIPSVPALKNWMKRTGFREIELVDVSDTTIEEQRSTRWMKFESLADFLDPDNASLTIEGYPAPKRAILLAKKGR